MKKPRETIPPVPAGRAAAGARRFRPLAGLGLAVGLMLAAAAPLPAAPRVRIGVERNTPPLSFVDAQNRPSGFTAEMLREVAHAGAIDLEIVPDLWTNILADFQAGRLDALANVTILEERRASMDFSIGHVYTHGSVYFRADRPAIRRVADLAGKRIATLGGSVGYTSAVAHRGWGGTIVPCTSWQAALDATDRGDCDAALLISHVASKVTDDHGLKRQLLEEIVHQFHIAVHKGDTETLARLNEALATVRQNGTFDRLYAKWIGPVEPHPIRFADLRPYFLPAAAVLLAVLVVIGWQRRLLNRLSQQAAALRESKERWKFAVEGSRDGMWDWDIATGEVLRSARLEELLGFAEGELGRRYDDWDERIHRDDSAQDQAAMRAHHEGRTPHYANEHRMRTKDGQWKWFLERGLVVSRDAAGRPLRMIGTVTDISERKAVEATVQKLNVELEERVKARTAELAGRVAEVERLNGELEAFSYSVSHDLRAPVRNITGLLELLGQRTAGRLDAEATRYVTSVATEARRMVALIDALLEFSRVGRTALADERVELGEVVAEVRAQLAPELAGRNVEWRVGALPAVRGDRTLLHQVMVNLLGNAVKFTARREVAVIEVTAEMAGAEVTVTVRDNGAGFNPKYADKLFGVFQRLHSQRDFGGVGIGLANVKRIVERHGGRIWAEGRLQAGAAFNFTVFAADP